MLGVVHDDTAAAVRDFRADEGGTWSMVLDPDGRVAFSYGVAGVPEAKRGFHRLNRKDTDMDSFLWLLPVLGCAGGMALCMWFMSRMGGHHAEESSSNEVSELREEVARLRREQEAERAGADG